MTNDWTLEQARLQLEFHPASHQPGEADPIASCSLRGLLRKGHEAHDFQSAYLKAVNNRVAVEAGLESTTHTPCELTGVAEPLAI